MSNSTQQPIKKILFYSAYGDKNQSSIIFPEGEDMCKQSFAAECDINNIMAQYQRTGTLEFTNAHSPQYGDATGVDFQTAMNIVITAENMFAEMPAHLRKKFDNDPSIFMDFIDNPENRTEAIAMGLLRVADSVPMGDKKEASPADPTPSQEASKPEKPPK